MVKHLPTMWETRVQSLGREDPLEKEMATHSSILAWKIPWTEEPGRLQSMGSQRVGQDWATFFLLLSTPASQHTHTHTVHAQPTHLSCSFIWILLLFGESIFLVLKCQEKLKITTWLCLCEILPPPWCCLLLESLRWSVSKQQYFWKGL